MARGTKQSVDWPFYCSECETENATPNIDHPRFHVRVDTWGRPTFCGPIYPMEGGVIPPRFHPGKPNPIRRG